MFYKHPNQYIHEGQPFKIDGVQYPASWLYTSTPAQKMALGLSEVITLGAPEDPRLFYTSEQLVGAVRTIINTPKSPEQVAELLKGEAQADIDRLEREQMMPRATREFMLTFMELNASPEVLAANYGYQAVKAFDEKIKQLRAKL
jgi:hypothetical protein